jgi:hypothetical protein
MMIDHVDVETRPSRHTNESVITRPLFSNPARCREPQHGLDPLRRTGFALGVEDG